MLELNFAPVFKAFDQLMAAAMYSLAIGVAAMVLAMLVGTLGMALSQMRSRAARRAVLVYVDLFRGTPLLVQILVLFYGPSALGVPIPPYTSGIIALGLYYGAYIMEIMRGAFESIPAGHVDAARAMGMPGSRIFWRIQLPQTIAVVVSPLSGQFARLFKASSLLSVIGVTELTVRGHVIMTNTLAPIETWLVVAGIYLFFNTIVVVGAHLLEQHLTRGRR
ncbi:amino acid ABC transporter permease [Variovorax sp. PBL-E5]|uniref:amino acid ABC transporter permease n=1 Tax=Variovorax sp. PBL-E5 TaxID=434014 RepID=UPI0013168658|nr:amino acid ABC transporter permease [Variovorax sp. PBL-E5]VTU16815.1 L-cystine transport system permease protein TcyB [Variovorax sp. PBL-E5]